MAANVDLIYCSHGNYYMQQIAIDNGFKFGLKLPYRKILNKKLFFSDQDWKNPDREKYVNAVREYKPKIATVLDLEHRAQLPEVISWAEEISPFVKVIVIIPKCTGVIGKLPREINGKNVRLGYSVPSKYGATSLKPKAFDGWEVHLLGGSPERQLSYRDQMNVVSVDCNYHSMKANRFGEYWTGKFNHTRWWKKLEGKHTPFERSLKAFEISCRNIYKHWKG